MLVWADIENEPQVQYLPPIAEACRRRGAETIVTARDYGSTFIQLESRGVDYRPVGAAYGASKPAKVVGLARRSLALSRSLRGTDPDSLVCASRAAVLAARGLRIPSYVISDYEHANLTSFRWAGSTILYPDVVDPDAYRKAGFAPGKLISFRGLKEDITFAGVDLDAVPAWQSGVANEDAVLVLVRPPAEESHYYSQRSRQLYLEALRFLADDERTVVVLAPRYPRQLADLDGLPFANPPIRLERPVAFVELLKAVDLVLCSGGTMLREAAYLGIPAYSIFGSELGDVDRYLASIGRATLLGGEDELARITIAKTPELKPLRTNPELVDELAAIVTRAA